MLFEFACEKFRSNPSNREILSQAGRMGRQYVEQRRLGEIPPAGFWVAIAKGGSPF